MPFLAAYKVAKLAIFAFCINTEKPLMNILNGVGPIIDRCSTLIIDLRKGLSVLFSFSFCIQCLEHEK